MLIPDILSLHGHWRANAPALVFDDETISWRVLSQRINQVANGLLRAGCQRGDRVGVFMNNGAPMVEVLLGAMKAGAIVAPLNTSVGTKAATTMFRDAGAKFVFAAGELAGENWPSELPALQLYVVQGGGASTETVQYAAWREAQSSAAPEVTLSRADGCSIIYSSGTTGTPKGIFHTHGARTDWAQDLAHALRYHSGARTLITTGLYSNITWATMFATLLLGGTLIIRKAFDVEDALRAIETHRATHAAMVPVQYQRLLAHPATQARNLTSLQQLMCCGSPLAVHTKVQLFERFPNGVIELYGSTEGVITTLAPEEASSRMLSVGKPLPGEDLVIVNDDDRPVSAGMSGEIVALSRFAMNGYWNNVAATREAHWSDDKGRLWLRTGDIGRLDDEGYLYITDRKKDVILSGGQNVYPADIEAVLMEHPDILDCAVIGVPSERWGETPLALVVLRSAGAATADEILAWTNAQLGNQQRVNRIEFRDALPRNANGKLLKRELRTPYWPQLKVSS